MCISLRAERPGVPRGAAVSLLSLGQYPPASEPRAIRLEGRRLFRGEDSSARRRSGAGPLSPPSGETSRGWPPPGSAAEEAGLGRIGRDSARAAVRGCTPVLAKPAMVNLGSKATEPELLTASPWPLLSGPRWESARTDSARYRRRCPPEDRPRILYRKRLRS